MHLTSEGSFKAARSKVPRRSARAPAAPSVPRARSAIVGAEFEESLISWKVVGVDWSEELDEVVVWYYDVAIVADLELDEGEVNLARKTGVDLASLECSSTCDPPVDLSLNERARDATGVALRCFVGLYAALMSSRHIYFYVLY